MQFAGSTEEDEDKKAASHPGYPSEALQVHRTAWPVQEAVLSCCVPIGIEAEQHCG